MRCKYLPQDYSARIHGGVAFYKGVPVLIHVRDNNTLDLVGFPTEEIVAHILPDDEDLDLSAPTLGYANYKKYAVYWYRRPDRKYKQTLTNSSCQGFYPGQEDAGWHTMNEEQFYSNSLKNMLMDTGYPTLSEALLQLNGKKVTSIAISRDIALYKDSYDITRVYYKTNEVGHILPSTGVVVVPEAENAWIISKYLSEINWTVR